MDIMTKAVAPPVGNESPARQVSVNGHKYILARYAYCWYFVAGMVMFLAGMWVGR